MRPFLRIITGPLEDRIDRVEAAVASAGSLFDEHMSHHKCLDELRASFATHLQSLEKNKVALSGELETIQKHLEGLENAKGILTSDIESLRGDAERLGNRVSTGHHQLQATVADLSRTLSQLLTRSEEQRQALDRFHILWSDLQRDTASLADALSKIAPDRQKTV